jgi:hypothetical protein
MDVGTEEYGVPGDELHSGAIRDFVVRQFDAILIRTKSDLWATSWQALWEE